MRLSSTDPSLNAMSATISAKMPMMESETFIGSGEHGGWPESARVILTRLCPLPR